MIDAIQCKMNENRMFTNILRASIYLNRLIIKDVEKKASHEKDISKTQARRIVHCLL